MTGRNWETRPTQMPSATGYRSPMTENAAVWKTADRRASSARE